MTTLHTPVNIIEHKELHAQKIAELEELERSPEPKKLKFYLRCKGGCNEIHPVYGNYFSKQGYCANCWEQKLAQEGKKSVEHSIGGTILNIELSTDHTVQAKSVDDLRVRKIIVRGTDGKTYEYESRFIQIR